VIARLDLDASTDYAEAPSRHVVPRLAMPSSGPTPRRPAFVEVAIAAILVASIHGFTSIPFVLPFGVDLHNLYAFHHCEGRNEPYLWSGIQCGDPGGRDMYYPPALYWFFVWLRLLSAHTATMVWTAIVAVGTLASMGPFASAQRWRDDGRLGMFAGLLLVSYPLLFSLERANNDVLVLVCFAGALAAWQRGRVALAGAVIGLACAVKLYPVTAAASLGCAVVSQAVARSEHRREAWKFALAGVAGAVVPTLLFLPDTLQWATHRLPEFAATTWAPSWFSHALVSTVGSFYATTMALVVLLVWGRAAVRRWSSDPALAVAGTLAASTVLARTSYDYNLITALPLLLVQFQRSTEGARWDAKQDLVLVGGVLAVVGHRGVIAASPELIHAKVLLLWGWLLASGLLAARRSAAPGRAVGASTAPESSSP
jgi:hypothetical protein